MRTTVAGLLAGIASVASAAEPSFDCAKATGETEQLVCATPELAQLDRELARLYALAVSEPDLTRAQRGALAATERGWVRGRDDCWKQDDESACVRSEYMYRIAELRRGYAAARAQDDAGISLGPYAARCGGLDAPLAATFINSDPGAVVLAWSGNAVVLDHAVSGSGARYEATLPAGHYLFWNKGDRAMFEAPGVAGTLDCVLAASR